MAHRTASLFMTLLILCGAGACGEPEGEALRAADAGLERLASWMTGVFSSAQQAEDDDRYLSIRLAVARIWPERPDGPWLYVEQAAERALGRPFRQRVCRLRRIEEGLYESRIHVLPDAHARAGAWKDPRSFADLEPEALEEKDGCAVVLRLRADGSFGGGTQGRECANSRGGAAYATSQVVLFADRLESWDRGHDAEDAVVWGPAAGPYVFRKIRDL